MFWFKEIKPVSTKNINHAHTTFASVIKFSDNTQQTVVLALSSLNIEKTMRKVLFLFHSNPLFLSFNYSFSFSSSPSRKHPRSSKKGLGKEKHSSQTRLTFKKMCFSPPLNPPQGKRKRTPSPSPSPHLG